eukprot:TRINITY_DN5795_c0_g1_i3.p1 TRINITY_DN5795_c0_g1~~TRINITY_DN5795_c0_g1_i3.p1  ORF type:complete len:544 (-),score=116.08 TRINITY_DN5795_c0_g1_i3:132-1763(-)
MCIRDSFEAPLLEDVRQYYKSKSNQWLSLSVPEYVNYALDSLKDEENRADKYYRVSKHKIIEMQVAQIVTDPAQKLAYNEQTGIFDMVSKNKIEELRNIFLLYSRNVETIGFIANQVSLYINVKGKSFANDPKISKDPIQYATKVLEFKRDMNKIVDEIFEANMLLQKAKDQQFGDFMQQYERSAGYLAVYCDMELVKGMVGNKEKEVEEKIEAIMDLFKCIRARDIFLKQYTKLLAKRLLQGKSVSEDCERNLLAKLQMEIGVGEVGKLQKMMEDINISKDESEQFKKYSQENNLLKGLEVNVQVITGASWPNDVAQGRFKMPSDLQSIATKFEQWYQRKYHGRHLQWLMNQGTSDLNFLVNEKSKYLLKVTNAQVCILMLFNRFPDFTFEKLLSILEMKQQDLVTQLVFLVKNGVLIKENPEAKESFEMIESISINKEFKNVKKIVPCIPQKSKSAPEPSPVIGEIDEIQIQRANVIDAAVVRIMKARRKAMLNDIQAECLKLITLFKPQPLMIKQRIETLIERDFLKRNENTKTLFEYIA